MQPEELASHSDARAEYEPTAEPAPAVPVAQQLEASVLAVERTREASAAEGASPAERSAAPDENDGIGRGEAAFASPAAEPVPAARIDEAVFEPSAPASAVEALAAEPESSAFDAPLASAERAAEPEQERPSGEPRLFAELGAEPASRIPQQDSLDAAADPTGTLPAGADAADGIFAVESIAAEGVEPALPMRFDPEASEEPAAPEAASARVVPEPAYDRAPETLSLSDPDAFPLAPEPASEATASQPAPAPTSFDAESYFERASALRDKGLFAVAARLYAECAVQAGDRATVRKAAVEEMACHVKAGSLDQARRVAEELSPELDLMGPADRVKVAAVLGAAR